MAAAREWHGIAASPGIGRGAAHVATDAGGVFLPQADAPTERTRLARAVEDAVASLRVLAERTDAGSAAILDFQIEMLLDPELLALTDERIDRGDGAALAWVGALDTYIADLETAEDEIVRARAVDLIDIKGRVLGALTGTPTPDFPAGTVFVGRDMEPSRFLAHDWTKGGGIVLSGGSVASHVALLARARRIPMVVAVNGLTVEKDDTLELDGSTGHVACRSEPHRHPLRTSSVDEASSADAGPGRTADGTVIRLSVNIATPDDLAGLDARCFDGIGLMRTEFLLRTATDIVDEEKQHAAYSRALSLAGGKPVTIRMLDLGGDKPFPGLGGGDPPSFLGLRGVRLLLARPEMARVQARALMRSAIADNLRVMVPMVTLPQELDAIRQIFAGEAEHLARRGVPHAVPPIGIMVEVPAAAMMLETFGSAAFFSLGTNDLAQYLAAAARDNAAVAPLYAQTLPALLRLVRAVVDAGGAMGRPIAICGDIAGEPAHLPALLACGLRHFSVAPARLPALRSALAGVRADGTTATDG